MDRSPAAAPLHADEVSIRVQYLYGFVIAPIRWPKGIRRLKG